MHTCFGYFCILANIVGYSWILWDIPVFSLQKGRAHVLAHPVGIKIVAQSMKTHNVKIKIQGEGSCREDTVLFSDVHD